MRHFKFATPLGLLMLPLLSCDGVIVGRLNDDPGPPVLVKLLIQDELPSGGRNVATDLIDKTPTLTCSDQVPCPSGDRFSHPLCNLTTGICPAPLKPTETPPAIGAAIAGSTGGVQIRLVFSKMLSSDLEVQTIDPATGMVSGYALKDPSMIALYDGQGKIFASCEKIGDRPPTAKCYWDSTGSPALTSDLFVNPFGPAIVMKPVTPFQPLTAYSLRIKPEAMKDVNGRAVEKDINGDAIATSYDFTTEGFHAAGGALTDYDKFPDTIDVKDALTIKTTTPYDHRTLKVTVRTKDGQLVETVASPEFGTDPTRCFSIAAQPQQINIFRVTGQKRTDWTEGDYTVSIDVKASVRCDALFSIDPFGKTPYHDIPFRAMVGVDKDKLNLAEDLLLESECGGVPLDPKPGCVTVTDMGLPPDLSTPADLTVPADLVSLPDQSMPDQSMPDLGVPPDMAIPDDMTPPDDMTTPSDMTVAG